MSRRFFFNLQGTNESLNFTSNSHTIGNVYITGGNVGINTTSPSVALDVAGGLQATNVQATNLSTGTLQAPSGITVGNINFTGSLYQNGTPYLGSQWTTTSGNVSYTSGSVISSNLVATNSTVTNVQATNVSAGTLQAPNVQATDLSTGTLQAPSGITVGNINFTGSLYQNGTPYLGSQWTTTSGNVSYTSGSVVSSNLVATNSTVTNVQATTLSAGNIAVSGNLSVAGTLTTVNMTTTNLIDTNVSAGNANITSLTSGNVNATNITASSATIWYAKVIGSTSISGQGLHLQWNRSGGDGEAHIINQKGLGGAAAAIILGKADQSNNFTEQMRITDAGNVGIGTSTPIGTLEVNASGGNTSIKIVSGSSQLCSAVASGNGLYSTSAVTGDSIIRAETGKLHLQSGTGGSAITINSSGNVGIGSTTAAYTLDVNGSARFTNAVATNVSSATLNLSTGVTSASAQLTNANITSLTAASSQLTNATATNLLATNATITNLLYANVSTGNIIVSGINLGVTSMFSGSFANVQQTQTNALVTGLIFDSTQIGSFVATVSVNIVSTSLLNCVFTLTGNYSASSSWTLYASTVGDTTGITFGINSSGQVLYSSSVPGTFVSGTFRYNVQQMSATASYTYTSPTMGSYSMNTLTINSTTNANGFGSGGNLTVLGGTSIAKDVYVGGNLNLGISSMFSGSFSASNNVAVAANVTGLGFANADIRSFTAYITVSILVSAGSNLYAVYTLTGSQTDAGWSLYTTNLGDTTGITFTITSAGQVQYTSTNVSNFSSSTLRYSVQQFSNTGTYGVFAGTTQGSYIVDTIQINNTTDSIRGTSTGGLYTLGGATITKSLNILDTDNATGVGSGGSLTVLGGAAVSSNLIVGGSITAANLALSGNLSVAGTLTTVNLTTTNLIDTNITAGSANITNATITTLTAATARVTSNFLATGNSNTLGNLFTTGGNVGIGTSAPACALDVNGGIISRNQTPALSFLGDIVGARYLIKLGGYNLSILSDSGSFTGFESISTSGSTWASGAVFTSTGGLNIVGKLGIGTNTPAYSLDVNGTGRITNVTATNVSSATLNLSTGITTGTVRVSNDVSILANSGAWNSTAGKGLYARYSTNSGQDSGYIQSIDRSTTTFYPLSIQSKETWFTIGGGSGFEKMIIASSGNVGIGTTVPAYRLDVNGGGIKSNSTSLTNGNIIVTNNVGGGVIQFEDVNHSIWGRIGQGGETDKMQFREYGQIEFWTGGLIGSQINRMTITSSGNVGIGTQAPSSLLTIQGPSAAGQTTFVGDAIEIGAGRSSDGVAFIDFHTAEATYGDYSMRLIRDSGANGGTSLGHRGTGPIQYICQEAGAQIWATSNTERMRLTADGNLGIGTAAPGVALEIAGQVSISNGNLAAPTASLYGGSGTKLSLWTGGASASPYAIGIEASNMWFSSGGAGYKWYNGASASPSAVMQLTTSNLIVTGDVIAYGSISDQRLKTNITDLNSALDTVNALRPVTFNWCDDVFNEEKRGLPDVGFIAQEVEQVTPLAVGEYPEITSGIVYKNMKHERLIPYLTGAIQELTAKYKALSAENTELKATIQRICNHLNI